MKAAKLYWNHMGIFIQKTIVAESEENIGGHQ